MENLKKCEICGLEAKSLCLNCIMYLCENCYKFVHEKDINKNHNKEKIDYFCPIETKCPEHKKDRINLFCVDEKGKQYIIINY